MKGDSSATSGLQKYAQLLLEQSIFYFLTPNPFPARFLYKFLVMHLARTVMLICCVSDAIVSFNIRQCEVERGKWQCPFCEDSLSRKQTFLYHLAKKHPDVQVEGGKSTSFYAK